VLAYLRLYFHRLRTSASGQAVHSVERRSLGSVGHQAIVLPTRPRGRRHGAHRWHQVGRQGLLRRADRFIFADQFTRAGAHPDGPKGQPQEAIPGANGGRYRATQSDELRQSVQLNALQSDARRRTTTLLRCLLSSGSRVRILPGALSETPRQCPSRNDRYVWS
jgi:hypothetical protein